MPQVSLSAQQQAQVDSANEALASAQKDYDAKNASVNQSYIKLKKLYDTFLNAKCHYNYQDSFETQIRDYGKLNRTSCRDKIGGCNKEKCEFYVGAFNVEFDAWKTKQAVANQANQAVQQAKDKLNQVLDAIAKDPTVSANASIINNEIEAQKQKDKIKWLFFGLAAVAIVIGAIVFGLKVIGRGASA